MNCMCCYWDLCIIMLDNFPSNQINSDIELTKNSRILSIYFITNCNLLVGISYLELSLFYLLMMQILQQYSNFLLIISATDFGTCFSHSPFFSNADLYISFFTDVAESSFLCPTLGFNRISSTSNLLLYLLCMCNNLL